MANTAVKVSSSANHLVYQLTGDGTVVGPTIASATLLNDMVAGPLKAAWTAAFANQAAMRVGLLGGGAACEATIQLAVTVLDVTAERNQVTADVDTDAVTASRAEINKSMSDTTGQIAFLKLTHWQSIVE